MTSLEDVDGDGVVDLAVGANRDDSTKGAVWLLFLNTDGTEESSEDLEYGRGLHRSDQ